jgi:hypothetical protein
MKTYIILRLMFAMLSTDEGGAELAQKHLSHLEHVAEIVSEVATAKSATLKETRMLIAIAMRESRFGIPYKRYFPKSPAGACGIWQVKPILFDPSTKTTHNESCDDFKDIHYAAKRGLESIRYWIAKKGRICHYNQGWRRCGRDARKYERDVNSYMDMRASYIAANN